MYFSWKAILSPKMRPRSARDDVKRRGGTKAKVNPLAKQHRRTQSAPSRKAIEDKSAGGSSADAGVPWHLGKGAAAMRTPRALDDDPGDVLGASSAPAAAPKKRFLGRRGKEK